jgi:hypothetical protein
MGWIWPWSEIRRLRAEIEVLKAELKVAQRNDARDEDGRFTRTVAND